LADCHLSLSRDFPISRMGNTLREAAAHRDWAGVNGTKYAVCRKYTCFRSVLTSLPDRESSA
jgi:hypothetical protein